MAADQRGGLGGGGRSCHVLATGAQIRPLHSYKTCVVNDVLFAISAANACDPAHSTPVAQFFGVKPTMFHCHIYYSTALFLARLPTYADAIQATYQTRYVLLRYQAGKGRGLNSESTARKNSL